MPGLGLLVSTKYSPEAYRQIVPKGRRRSISCAESAGKVCSKRTIVVETAEATVVFFWSDISCTGFIQYAPIRL